MRIYIERRSSPILQRSRANHLILPRQCLKSNCNKNLFRKGTKNSYKLKEPFKCLQRGFIGKKHQRASLRVENVRTTSHFSIVKQKYKVKLMAGGCKSKSKLK